MSYIKFKEYLYYLFIKSCASTKFKAAQVEFKSLIFREK